MKWKAEARTKLLTQNFLFNIIVSRVFGRFVLFRFDKKNIRFDIIGFRAVYSYFLVDFTIVNYCYKKYMYI